MVSVYIYIYIVELDRGKIMKAWGNVKKQSQETLYPHILVQFLVFM